MKISEVLFAAAQHPCIKDGACWAIAETTHPKGYYIVTNAKSAAMTYFKKLLMPVSRPGYWWPLDDHRVRQIALLLAAEVAKSEGL